MKSSIHYVAAGNPLTAMRLARQSAIARQRTSYSAAAQEAASSRDIIGAPQHVYRVQVDQIPPPPDLAPAVSPPVPAWRVLVGFIPFALLTLVAEGSSVVERRSNAAWDRMARWIGAES